MKMKLLASAAIAVSMTFSAAADIKEKRFDKDKVETKELASQDDLEYLFDEATAWPTTYLQQSRIKQEGGLNDAEVDQSYSDEGLAQIRQDGYFNGADIFQGDFRPTAAPFRRATNIAVVDQVGANNYAHSHQDYLRGYEPTNIVEIHQVSSDYNTYYTANYASAYQAGSGNDILINQAESHRYYNYATRNNANAVQYGDNHSSTIDQRGDNNYASSYQDNDYGGNTSVIYQEGSGYGYANAAHVTQTGYWNDAHVEQYGDGNWADVVQTSNENLAHICQDGSDNEASIEQHYGDLNSSLIIQAGYANSAASYQ